MLVKQGILQAAIFERKNLVIEYENQTEQVLRKPILNKIIDIDNLIRCYLTSPIEFIKKEYNSECETESTSSNNSLWERETIRFENYQSKGENQKLGNFEQVNRNSEVLVEYIKTRRRQYFRKIDKMM